MATALQNLINAYIKRNANQEITGPVLNGVLTAIANALGTPFVGSDGYWYTYDAETGQFVKTDTPAQGETGPVGVTEAAATIDDQIGTPSVAVSLDGTRLDFTFRNLKGQKGDTGDAGITAAVVTVDAGIGTPSVDASITGTTLTLAFHNLKGETGAAAGFGTIEATVEDTTGTPAVVVTTSGPDTAKNLSFAFSGLKGPKGDQGNTGVSADYPITIANNLTTDDPTAALAASQGVVLKGEIDQLGQKATDLYPDLTLGITYTTNVSVGDVVSSTPSSSASWAAGIFECVPGDVFNFDATGGSGARLWCFTDADYKCLSKAPSGARTEKVTAPSNAAFLFVNINTGYTPHTFEKIIKRIDTIEEELAKTIGDVSLLQGVVDSSTIVPVTTANVSSSSATSVFDYKDYVVQKGMRVRMTMVGFGTIVSGYRWYESNGTTHTVSSNPNEFIADSEIHIKRVAVRTQDVIVDGGSVSIKVECIGVQQSISEIEENMPVGIDGISDSVGSSSKIAISQKTFTEKYNETTSEFSEIKAIRDSSNIAPETTATIVTGQTNNVFNNQSYQVKKGMRVRVMMAGLGTIIERFRMYDNIGNTYYIEESPYDFIADDNFAITRIAVVSGAVIKAGQVTAKIDCVGYQQAITELQTKIKEDAALVSLQTIKDAASTDGNVFTENISIVAPSGKISSIFQVASKYIKTEEYDEVAGEIPRIVFNNGFSYCLSGEQLTIKEFRVPQTSQIPGNITIDITIPAGVQLIISDFVQRYSSEQNRGDLLIYNHGRCGASHFCCKGAWEKANEYGAYGAIVVPKRTSDGKWVCFHDDGNVNGVMFYEDKSEIPGGVTVNNSTFAETQLWRYKTAYTSQFNINPDGTATTDKIPLLEDFFKLCAKTGMRPCLSWHPYPTDIENGHYRDFVEMKALADKYGITNKLCIKIGSSGADRLVDLHSVFGDSLDMVLVNVGNKTYEEILGYLQNGGNDIFDKTKTKYGIEYSSDMDIASETVINNLVAGGYIVGMCYITDGERMEWCIEHGIRDYTLDNFASWGLHW